MEEKTFVKPNDLNIIVGDSDIIIRKGFVHLNEIIIDKEKSSYDFIETINKLITDGQVTVSEKDEVYGDLIQLNKMGLLNTKVDAKILVVANNDICEFIENNYNSEIDLCNIEDVLSRKEILTLNEDKNQTDIIKTIEKAREKLGSYECVYVIDAFKNVTTLRAFNRVLFEIDKSSTFAFYDNENIYVTNIQPKTTGCYECLEKHISTKFPNTIDYYSSISRKNESGKLSEAEIMILLGIIFKDIDNVNRYGNTSLEGQVIHFYLPNFEYSYNTNRRHVACKCCAGLNKVMFEEQNIKAINLIKEVVEND